MDQPAKPDFMTSRIYIIVLFGSVLLAPWAQALDELPLGTAKEKIIQAYGQPNQMPIHSGPGPEATAEDAANTACYFSLQPPRFYHFRDNRAAFVHYYNLNGKDLDFVSNLLKIHAVGSKIEEISPKILGWESSPDRMVKAWRCLGAGWMALYRKDIGPHPETNTSLLIYIEDKKGTAK